MIIYKTRDITIYDSLHKERSKRIFIVKFDSQSPKFILPSPLTYFVLKYGKSYNTQRKYANELCGFINYLISKVQQGGNEMFEALKIQGLSGLTFYHLANYLNHISNNPEEQLSLDTVLIKQNVLYNFYKYLSLSKINKLNDDVIEKMNILNSQVANRKRRKVSPFDLCPDIVIKYPKQLTKSNGVLKDMPEELWNLFVEYAEEYYQPIAFGVLLTICSGIRRGGCVNLRVKDVKQHKHNHLLYLDIKDNQLELFGERDINLNNSQVKKVRKKQPVLPLHSRILEIFDTHKKYLMKVYNSQHIEDKALFVNADGLPMSGDSYSTYFSKLKQDFIEFLQNEGLPVLAQQMREYRWATHIGRHIFTNTIVKKGYANGSGNKPIPKLVALLRGDSSEESSMVYIDEFTLSEAVSKNINDISKIAAGNDEND